MKGVLLGLLVAAVVGLTAGPAFAQRGRGASPFDAVRNGWLSDYRQAKEQARQSGKPMMLVFRCVP